MGGAIVYILINLPFGQSNKYPTNKNAQNKADSRHYCQN